MNPRIAVVGTGANGAGIAANLADAGHDITLIEQWPANVEAIRARGIVTEMPDETITSPIGKVLHLCDVATSRAPFDIVLLLVKAYDTRWATELIKPHLGADGIVVALQNGLTLAPVADIVGPPRAVGAVIEVSAAMYRPGVVERHTPPTGSWFGIGAEHPVARERARAVRDILSVAGTVEFVDDIRSAKWMKLVVNAAELAPSAITGLPLLAAAQQPGMHEFMLAAGREAMDAALAAGNKVVPIFGRQDVDPTDPHGAAEILLGAVYANWSVPTTRTTILQDWDKGRHAEYDEINGAVVRALAAVGRQAPVNQRIVEISREIEDGTRSVGTDNIAALVGTTVAGKGSVST